MVMMSSSIKVSVESGVLRGLVCENETDFNKHYYSFQGVPYAKPPIGELRFKLPQKVEPWNGARDATKDGPQCFSRHPIKKKTQGSEDCLYLNVFTPKLPGTTGDNDELKPVMVYIHGGAFLYGSNSKFIYNPEYLLREDVIVVTLNYRLGLLGFISFKDPTLDVPTNIGVRDIVMALKWIRNNIRNFNGDPNNVTIFGESAGGIAVHLLILSLSAKGLFHKAIAQSGSVLNLHGRARIVGPELADVLGVDRNDEKKVLQILKNMSVEELLDIQEKLPYEEWDSSEMPAIGYVVENSNHSGEALFSEEPSLLLERGEYNHVPFLLGYTSGEGMLVHLLKKTPLHKRIPNIEQYVPYLLGLKRGSPLSKQVAHNIIEYYYGDKDPENADIDDTYKLLGDNFFLKGILTSAILHSKSSMEPLFFYEMTLDTSINQFKNFGGINRPGACHGDDLSYLFKSILHKDIEPNSPEDIGIRRFCRLWTNFAKYGNPNSPKQDPLLPVLWKPFTTRDQDYLEIGKDLLPKNKPIHGRITFWNEIYKLKQTRHKL